MKKILITLCAVMLALPSIGSAATFSFTPSTGTFAPGQTFTVSVYVNPVSGEEITTAKLAASFNPATVEVVSFAQSAGWLSLQQPLVGPADDLIDNTSGQLVKTGGYPAKVKAPTLFGTLTLKALADGVATLNVGSEALLLDSTNTNRFTSATQTTYTVATPVIVPVVVNEPARTTETSSGALPAIAVPVNTTTEVVSEENTNEAVAIEENTEEQTAAAAAADSSGALWYYILALLALLGGGFGAWFVWKRGK